ncbi:MAG: acylphosphatase [Bacteroidetes bacterium]|nr:acylphosphatase [Bacteroidota bacterium]
MKHMIIKVTGLVQGVYFRASAKEMADELGIKGFVRNEPDNSVYIEAEAEENALAIFIEWCQHGPPSAQIDKLQIETADLKEYTGFAIE